MKTYLFSTTCTMKPYNCEKWYIMSDFVKSIKVKAENIKNALEYYREILDEKYFISISDHAMKHKEAMYVDRASNNPIQTGYVLTGKTGFESRSDNVPYTEQYIEVWVTINTIENPFEMKGA